MPDIDGDRPLRTADISVFTGDRQYLDPNLQAQRCRATGLPHRHPAADRRRAHQEPRPARTATVELASAIHDRRPVVIAATDYLAAPAPRQSAAAVVTARRLLDKRRTRGKHRPYPLSDASFPGRAGQPEIDRAVAKALDGLAGAEQVFDPPERVARKFRRTPPRRVESRDRDHRKDGQFRDRRKFGGQAAIACGCGCVSLAGWNFCP